MKTKSIFILAALVVLNIQSCNNFLDEKLKSDVAAVTYYKTAAGMEDAVDATYYYLKLVYTNERAHSLTVFGTDTYTNGADGGFKNFNYYDKGLRSDVSILQEMWQWCYRGVNQANAVVGRIGDIPTKDMSDATKNLRIAEVRFLRALYYFTLTRQWGDVPTPLTETVDPPTTSAIPAPQADVYDKVMVPDLEFAIATLPATQNDYGRATKGAAQHLLGMVLLTRGYTSFAKSDDFSRAEGYFTSVIGGPYALQSDMGKLWDQNNQRNSEIIFAAQNSTNVILNSGGDGQFPGEGNRAHLYYLMEYDTQPGMIRDIANGRPFKRFRPTNYLMDLWAADRDKDNRFDLTYKQVWISNNAGSIPKWSDADVTAGAKNKDGSSAVSGQLKYAVGDTAIYIPGPGNEAKWTPAKKAQTRYLVFTRDQYTDKVFSHISKFMDPLRPAIQWQEGSRNWFIMRLGDTYLSRAEARFQMGNLAGAALDINVVRTRAAKPGKVAAMQISPAQVTMDFILDERARELDAEMCRWYDLTRTGTLVTRVKQYNPLAQAIQQYHVRRPYPQTQIDRTLPVNSFKQNCGYTEGDPCK
jgi:hypothetical protein